MKYTKKSKKVYVAKVKKTYKKKGTSRATVKAIVKREIARNIENKNTQLLQDDIIVRPVSFGINVYALTPYNGGSGTYDIAKGDNVNQRHGNEIKTKSLIMKGVIWPKPYNAGSNSVVLPVDVIMYFYYAKDTPNVLPNPASDFFQLGGNNTGFTGELQDMLTPINTEKYKVVLTKKFKIGFSQYGNNGDAISQFFCNNDYKYSKMFSLNLTKYLPQFVRWDDGTVIPKTRGLFCTVVPIPANGGVFPNSSIPIGLTYVLDYTYEDA